MKTEKNVFLELLNKIEQPVKRSSVTHAENVPVDQLFRPRKTPKPRKAVESGWKTRFEAAHKEWFKNKFPAAWKDGHYTKPSFPKVHTANGLQNAIVSYLEWTGHYGNRINTMGRKVNGKWIPGTTKKGTSDLNCIIAGKAVHLEVKIGKDVQSENQQKQESKVNRAGGIYRLVKTMDEFYLIYDDIVSSVLF